MPEDGTVSKPTSMAGVLGSAQIWCLSAVAVAVTNVIHRTEHTHEVGLDICLDIRVTI